MEEEFKKSLREQAEKLDTEIYEKQKEMLRLKTDLRRVRDARLGIYRLLNEKPIERPKRKYKKSKNIDEKSEGEAQ